MNFPRSPKRSVLCFLHASHRPRRNTPRLLLLQLHLEEHGVERLPGGLVARPTGPSAWQPDRALRGRPADQGGVLRPGQRRAPGIPPGPPGERQR
ncbi:hypothetical protein EYF80_065634 [Liparis tanakae]|uniref:Uncharacterized protein n=1 Tax=Liparis tanakae TaxID=230148 RepID=A0A4Z2E6G8_9TELE|nr:hypothetical protein EYF80_065634 [Liparis tanakae]